MQWYLFLAFLFVLSISVFAIQNSRQVTLQFLYWELPPLPLVLVILFSAAMGVLITLLFSLAKQLKMTMQIRDLQSRLKQLEKKLSAQPDHGNTGPACATDNQPGHKT